MDTKVVKYIKHGYHGADSKPNFISKSLIKRFNDDRDFALELVKECPCYLQYLSESLKSDKEVVTLAVIMDDHAFDFASDDLKNDEEFVYSLLKFGSNVYKNLNDKLKNDRKFALETASRNGNCLSDLPKQFREDKEIVLKAYQHEYEKQGIDKIPFTFRFDYLFNYWVSNMANYDTTETLKKEISSELNQIFLLSQNEIKQEDIDKSLYDYDVYNYLLQDAIKAQTEPDDFDAIKDCDATVFEDDGMF